VSRSVSTRTTSALRKTRKRDRAPGVPFDPLALQTLRLTMRAFFRCGYSLREFADAATVEAALIPREVRPNGIGSRTDQDDWHRIVTLWSTDPEYVDDNGAPRSLRIWGAPPSIQALLQRVDSRLTVEEACSSLLRAGAARRVGRRLAAEAHPAFVHAPGSDEQSAHQFKVLNELVWNFEHNANLAGSAVPWVERQATAQVFPESALATYSLEALKRVMSFLQQEDALMQRLANSRQSEDPKVRAHLHVFFSAQGYPTKRIQRKSSESFNFESRGAKPTAGAAPTVSRQRTRRSNLARNARRKAKR
jgi:hypothetical protein